MYQDYGSFEIPGAGVVLTATGLQAVYSRASQSGIGYAQCPGACNFARNWTVAPTFPDTGYLEGWVFSGYSTPLAADAAGGLRLLYLRGADRTLHYGYCAGACDGPANWRSVAITGPYDWSWARLIAVAPGGAVHVLHATATGLIHAVCLGNCTAAASWQSAPVPGASLTGALTALALAFSPDGQLNLAYTDVSGAVTYGTCAGPCGPQGTWSFAALPLTSADVALATDSHGTVFLATNGGTVMVSRCDSGCLAPGAWRTDTVPAALGNGRVAIAVDSAGLARIASTAAGWPQVLQYTRMLR